MKKEKRFVVCGSMVFYHDMVELHKILMENNVPAIIPHQDGDISFLTNEQYIKMKRFASQKHMQEIRKLETVGIIVMNNEKHNIKDYIGGNTFAEIAIAFSHRKHIFLINEIPDFFQDELYAWGTVELKGDIAPVIAYYRDNDVRQPGLFDEY